MLIMKSKITLQGIILTLCIILAAGGLWFRFRPTPASDSKQVSKKSHAALYTCPMHPTIVRKEPGSCPICGMELIRRTTNPSKMGTSHEELNRPDVSLSADQRIMADIATTEARTGELERKLQASGSVRYDQARQAKVTAWTSGRLDRLYAATVGSQVTDSRPVAEIYSPDLVSAQEEYLLALELLDQEQGHATGSLDPLLRNNATRLVGATRQRLQLLGIPDRQIDQLARNRKVQLSMPLFSPNGGIVTEKLVEVGQYVKTGDILFSIADLSRVWVELEFYENEMASLKPGQEVRITTPSGPNIQLKGHISFLYPFMDAHSRTIRARVEVVNSGMTLRPDMFVTGIIAVKTDPAVMLPVTAVIDMGKRKIAWIERTPNTFEAREVTTGIRNDASIQILSGIRPGEHVAVSGAYLLDSESQLK